MSNNLILPTWYQPDVCNYDAAIEQRRKGRTILAIQLWIPFVVGLISIFFIKVWETLEPAEKVIGFFQVLLAVLTLVNVACLLRSSVLVNRNLWIAYVAAFIVFPCVGSVRQLYNHSSTIVVVSGKAASLVACGLIELLVFGKLSVRIPMTIIPGCIVYASGVILHWLSHSKQSFRVFTFWECLCANSIVIMIPVAFVYVIPQRSEYPHHNARNTWASSVVPITNADNHVNGNGASVPFRERVEQKDEVLVDVPDSSTLITRVGYSIEHRTTLGNRVTQNLPFQADSTTELPTLAFSQAVPATLDFFQSEIVASLADTRGVTQSMQDEKILQGRIADEESPQSEDLNIHGDFVTIQNPTSGDDLVHSQFGNEATIDIPGSATCQAVPDVTSSSNLVFTSPRSAPRATPPLQAETVEGNMVASQETAHLEQLHGGVDCCTQQDPIPCIHTERVSTQLLADNNTSVPPFLLSRSLRDTTDTLWNEVNTSRGNARRTTELLSVDKESLHLEEEEAGGTKCGAPQQPITDASAVHSRSQLLASSYRRLLQAGGETTPKERISFFSKEVNTDQAERSRQIKLLQDGTVIRSADADDGSPALNEMKRRNDLGAQQKPTRDAHEFCALHNESPRASEASKTHRPPRVVRVWCLSGKLAVELNSCDIPLMTVSDIINRFRHAESIPSDRVRMVSNGDDLDATMRIEELPANCPCHVLDLLAIVMPSRHLSRITTPTQMPPSFDIRGWLDDDDNDGVVARPTFESGDDDDEEGRPTLEEPDRWSEH